ncbi:putative MscS family protein YkuT [Streptococcus parasanguinis]|uniref:mechanosensitive ion channel family protein n=1 Tax=Streptococcus parasanguinis TaxID=1318 RepID=UPI001961E823|nr:mechanosensitive ion channel family protein [Streptococcus parasanguinis]VTY33075.1 putative MscS family protein YkuT [Streptococcus parasanguinis]
MSQVFQRYFQNIDWTRIADEVISKCISLLFLLFLFYIAKKVIHSLVKRILAPSFRYAGQDEARQKTILRLVESLLNYCLYFILIYWILSILGLPVSSLLAGAGIAGVAIGMGAQGFLSDLVNGFFILLERQLDVGDNVRLTNGSIKIAGIVSSVGIRTTQVRDFDGTLHFVPNRNITVVSNLSRGDMRVLVDIPLDANTDLDKIYQVITQVNQAEQENHPEVLIGPTIIGPQIEKNGRYSFRIAMTAQNGTQTTVYHTYYKLYHDALMEAGINLPTGKNGLN